MRLRAVALLVAVLPFSQASRKSDTPEEFYERARDAVWRGEYKQAIATAREGKLAFGGRPQWNELYSTVEAEALARDKPQNALRLLDKTPRTNNPEGRVRRLIAHGYASTAASEFDQAAADYAHADTLAKLIAPGLRGEIAVQRAGPPIRQGKYEIAEGFAREAIALGRAANDKFVLANALGMAATAEMNLRQFERALNDFNGAIKVAQSAGAKSTAQKITGNSGWCYWQLGDTEEAKVRFAAAYEGSELRVQPTWLTNISNVLIYERNYNDARAYAERSLAAAQELGDEDKIASSLENLARVNIELQHYGVAATLNTRSLLLRQKKQQWSEMLPARLNEARIDAATGRPREALAKLASIIREAEEKKVPQLLWTAQATAARIYGETGDATSAAKLYEQALETGDHARAKLAEESYAFAFEANLIRFYDEYIALLIRMGSVDDALRVAERSRARTLVQGLGFEHDRSIDPVALARKKNATILSYWLAPERSLLWIITPRGLSVVNLAGSDEIETEIDAYRAEIERGDPVYSDRGKHLYQLLVGNALPADAPRRVIVLPHGKINSINLETLVVPTPQPHFWVNDVTMSYASSLVLVDRPTPPRRARNGRLLVMGNAPSAGPGFPALSRAGVEVADVAGAFDRQHSVRIEGLDATAARYLSSEPSQFDYIHFVAHGTANIHAPLESAVIVADGKLTGSQIVKAPLEAQLVTISSCTSAGSRSYAGEGLVGLAWAFLRAGARRVVAAQWEVNDIATPKLMKQMYAGLADGHEPADALRTAKLAMLSSRKFNKPAYWAPFILYGAP